MSNNLMQIKMPFFFGFSGGIDSSFSSLLLKIKKEKIICFFIKNWEQNVKKCKTKIDFFDSLCTIQRLNIKILFINLYNSYKENVLNKFLNHFFKNYILNPDILCNKNIKFKKLQKYLINKFFVYLSSGHYVFIKKNNREERILKKSIFLKKDQTYFLYKIIKQKNIEIFILNKLIKKEIYFIFSIFKAPFLKKIESSGICFIFNKKFTNFVAHFLKRKEPTIVLNINFYLLLKIKNFNYHKFFNYSEGTRYISYFNNKNYYILYKNTNLKNTYIFIDFSKKGVLILKKFFYSNHFFILFKMFFLELILSYTNYRSIQKEKYKKNYIKTTCMAVNDSLVIPLKIKKFINSNGQDIVFFKNNICLGGIIKK